MRAVFERECEQCQSERATKPDGWVWPGHDQPKHQSSFAFLSPHQRILNMVGHPAVDAGENTDVSDIP